MSDENKITNEEELWDLISDPSALSKADKSAKPAKPAKQQKSGPKFAKPEAVKEPARRKIDGFFVACMAGVAAVSVAATLMISGMLGSSTKPVPDAPQVQDTVPGETASQEILLLERENAELRAQLEQQKKQIKDLQADLMNLMGSEEYLATVPSTPADGGDEVDAQLDARVQAYEIFAQIQEAYADFDRETLETLIPEMDARLSYLSTDALHIYYQILEYMEQPSNG